MTNGTAAAENVTATLTLPAGMSVSGISAAGWYQTGPTSLRRGGLAANASADVELSLTASASGPCVIGLDLKSDGSPLQSSSFPLTLLPSFAGWAAGLSDPAVTGDSDQDGISNLIEYAAGGDNLTDSMFFPETPEPLLPVISRNPPSLSFVRRTDATARGLSYYVESSDSLSATSWQALNSLSVSIISSPGIGFEKVAAGLPTPAADRTFYRLRIELAE